MYQRPAAELLGITQPAVQAARDLDKLMKEAGTTDAYVPVLEPPVDDKKLRRHLHPQYRFEPKLSVND
jgi:hypothetical protein